MRTPHKWAREIKAWADGADIEVRNTDAKNEDWHEWKDISAHHIHGYTWDEDNEYRIKPQPKEPQYLYVWVEKSTDNPVFELEKPNHILEDCEHKYVGKIKLEVDDGNDTRG